METEVFKKIFENKSPFEDFSEDKTKHIIDLHKILVKHMDCFRPTPEIIRIRAAIYGLKTAIKENNEVPKETVWAIGLSLDNGKKVVFYTKGEKIKGEYKSIFRYIIEDGTKSDFYFLDEIYPD